MSDNTAYIGSKFRIEFATLADGSTPGLEFLEGQEVRWQARLHVLFQKLGDFGKISNTEQFRKIGNDLWEFKAYQIRMPCYYRHDRRVVITHGFNKKGDKTPHSELQRAERIKTEYERIIARTSKQGGRIQ